MRWLDHRDEIPDSLRGAVIALGNFDGFHRGHQAVAGEAIDWAHSEGRPSMIATFEPHPVRFFKPDVAPFRLTTLEQRQELYLAAGATAMATGFKTNNRLAGVTPDSIPRTSILEALRDGGRATGMITTTDLTDATPAAFATHVPHRDDTLAVARQLLDARVNLLIGDATKARTKLGWEPEVDFPALVKMMVAHDLQREAAKAGIELPS